MPFVPNQQSNQPQPTGQSTGRFVADQAAQNTPQKTLGGFAQNAVSSTVNTAGGILGGLAGLFTGKTEKAIGDLALGGAQKFMAYESARGKPTVAETNATPQERVATSVADQYKAKYGSWDAIENSLYNDPAGTLLDLSAILDVGGAATHAVGEIGGLSDVAKAGETAAKAGEVVNPINAAGGVLSKFGSKVGGALEGAKTNIENVSKLSKVKPAAQEILDVQGTLQKMKDYGINKVADWKTAADNVTGDLGTGTLMVRQSLENISKPVDFSKVLDVAKQESGGTFGARIGKAVWKNVSDEARSTYKNIEDVVNSSFHGHVQHPNGTVTDIVDPVRAEKAIAELEKEKAVLDKKIYAIPVPTATAAEQRWAKIYDQTIKKMKDELYNKAGANNYVAKGGHLIGMEEELAKLPQKLQEELKNAKTIDELRSAQKSFVQAGKIHDLITNASKRIEKAPQSLWNKVVEGAAISSFTHTPLIALAPFIMDNPIFKEVVAQAGKTAGEVSGEASKIVGKTGKPVKSLAKIPFLQKILQQAQQSQNQ